MMNQKAKTILTNRKGERFMSAKKIIFIGFTFVFFVSLFGVLSAEEPVNPDKIPWRVDIQAAFDDANETGKPIVLNFTAPFNTG